MYRIFAALALAGVLAACSSSGGDSPLTSSDSVGVGTCNQPLVADDAECATDDNTTSTPVDPTDPDVYAQQFSDDLTVSGMSYDTASGELVLDNVPFDGDDNVYRRNATASNRINATSGSSFGFFGNDRGTAGAPTTEFFAVFRRSPDDYSQVGAMGTNRYVSYGFGGAAAQRLNGDGSLPNANQSYVFQGEYAAVRTIVEEGTNTVVQYVSGTSRIEVDIQDFNNVGAVEGIIADRRFFDLNGVEVPEMAGGVGDFVSLATAEINFDDWTITASDATLFVPNSVDKDTTNIAGATPNTQSTTGNWAGLFAGPNGEEVAGIVFVEGTGPVGIDTSTGSPIILTHNQVRETGVFQAKR
ncbi:hypothetical protein [Sagittula stellata]|uniref:Transferrin-binding protein B C-lobe/N-lobe beta barrel domain-containing protein n=1 Tax=Sagittula stellata (strain ATCC 700073 / DSM 11524 / E-37) TaxID=388399 RepID=A3K5B7_SAGS3|nr:hypothetical protein [Sagittula stellata]EBA07718.1 hypothetical protein SSE37_14068 [Sagittula stellata E-37]